MNIRYICQSCGGQASWDPNQNKILCENCGSQEFAYEIEERCPNCGSEIKFNDKLGTFYCSSCDYKIKEENIDDLDDGIYECDPDNLGTFDSNECSCSSCGAQIIVEPNTAATKCPFCGSNVQISKNLTGSAKPYGIIPFKQTKTDAQEAFKKWCKKGLVTPSGFMTADRIEEIKPVYIPFWMYDIEGLGQIEYDAQKIRRYSSGDYNVKEIKHYKCYRSIDAFIDDIPCDASERMDDHLMDLLEPFDLKELKPFNMGYLSGNLTEKYDYTEEELTNRIFKRANQFFRDYASTTMTQYSTYHVVRDDIRMKKKAAHYILLPVWTISYNYEGKKYTFVMNGQTGKVVGKPPISKQKVTIGWAGIVGILNILLLILGLF